MAELIGEGIKTVESNDVLVKSVKGIDLKTKESYDLIVIGSPNHATSSTRKVKKFISDLPNSQLDVKSFAVFDTYALSDKNFEIAMKKMEKKIKEKMPDLEKASPGLSIRVSGMKGPILNDELPKCKEFGIQLAK